MTSPEQGRGAASTAPFSSTSLPRLILLAVLTVLFSVGLAEIYDGIREFGPWRRDIDGGGPARWLIAAWVHTGLAAGIIAWRFSHKQRDWLLDPFGLREGAPAWLVERPQRIYLPAGIVVGGAGLLVLISSLAGGAVHHNTIATQIAWIIWIPVVEELVFRGGLSPLFRKVGGGLWGCWFAAIVFALVHANPTVSRVLGGHFGLPLGPLILGFATEAIVVTSGRIAPAIAFHAACNSTVAIFALGDRRWLEWLDFLYL